MCNVHSFIVVIICCALEFYKFFCFPLFACPTTDNIKESDRVSFKIDGIPRRAKAEVSYRKQAQIEHFKSILGRQQSYFTNTSFLSRSHLTPDADFVFSSGQFATYFYANVAPQFQSINGSNSKKNLANRTFKCITILTFLFRWQLESSGKFGTSVCTPGTDKFGHLHRDIWSIGVAK